MKTGDYIRPPRYRMTFAANLFNEKAIKELAAVLAKQDAQRTANETLREMDIKSIGLAEKIKEGIDKILV